MSMFKEPAIDRSLRGHKDTITSIAFHPSPSLLASTRKQSSTTEQLATSSLDGTLNLWNYSNDKKDVRAYRFVGHTGPVHNICYSPSGSLLASCSSDKTVRL